MNFLAEKYLAIEEGWLHNYLKAPDKSQETEKWPEMQMITAANKYTENELRWYFDINTEKANGKLVAIISVDGVLSRYWSGWIQQQVQVAAGNVNVVAIVLRMNTPGGAVNGTGSLAKEVGRVKVPVVAHTDFMCASAGIWIASKANEHYITSETTTGLGSIGVIQVAYSQHEYNQKQGFDYRVLRSKGSENKALLNPMEPLNEAALKEEQELINNMRIEMLSDMRASRPQISEDIDGAMYYGSNAIKAGLANQIGGLEDAVRRAFMLGMTA